MATATATIASSEMIERLERAAISLREGKCVLMKVGVFRASGWSKVQVIKFLLKELNEYVDDGKGVWKVWITFRSEEGYRVRASR